MEQQYWFRQRRYGIGAGLPIHWKGYALIAAWASAMAFLVLLAPLRPAFAVGGMILASLLLLWISWRKTEGGWRWRWG